MRRVRFSPHAPALLLSASYDTTVCLWDTAAAPQAVGSGGPAGAGGALALVAAGGGSTEWFEQGHEPYTQGDDAEYYLNLTKRAVMGAKADVLGVKLLSRNYSHLTYELVKSAVPPR